MILPSLHSNKPNYDATILADSPRAYWKLLETSGSSFADSSGNSQTLSLSGTGITYNQTAIGNNLNNCISLNSNNTYLTRNDTASSPLDIGDVWTLEAWIKPSSISLGDWANIIDKHSAYAMGFYRQTAGGYTQGEIISVRSQVAILARSTTNRLVATNGYHLVCVKNGTTREIWLNGVSVGSVSGLSNSTCVNNDNKINIGNAAGFESSGYQYLGGISNVAIYGTALSSTRIAAHYAAGIA